MVDRKSQASGLGVSGGHTSCRGQETCQQPKVLRIIRVALILVPSPWGVWSSLHWHCHLFSEKTGLRVGRARPGQDQTQATPYNGSTEATHPQLAAYRPWCPAG